MKAQSWALSLMSPLPYIRSPSTHAPSIRTSASEASAGSSGPVSMCAFRMRLDPPPAPRIRPTAFTLSSVIH